jgi:hypothetical protein
MDGHVRATVAQPPQPTPDLARTISTAAVSSPVPTTAQPTRGRERGSAGRPRTRRPRRAGGRGRAGGRRRTRRGAAPARSRGEEYRGHSRHERGAAAAPRPDAPHRNEQRSEPQGPDAPGTGGGARRQAAGDRHRVGNPGEGERGERLTHERALLTERHRHRERRPEHHGQDGCGTHGGGGEHETGAAQEGARQGEDDESCHRPRVLLRLQALPSTTEEHQHWLVGEEQRPGARGEEQGYRPGLSSSERRHHRQAELSVRTVLARCERARTGRDDVRRGMHREGAQGCHRRGPCPEAERHVLSLGRCRDGCP